MPTQNNFEIGKISERIKTANVPQDLAETLISRAGRLSVGSGAYGEVEQFLEYVEIMVSLPWEKKTEDILDIPHAKAVLDEEHYGLTDLKDRVLEYIAVMNLQKGSHFADSRRPEPIASDEASRDKEVDQGKALRAPILCFVGLVGTGKTTIAGAIAKALGRKFIRIPFGGLGDPGMLRGIARFHPGGMPGVVIKSLIRVGVKNPVILLDEIDRVDEAARASVMGVLVELLDPEQNHAFMDAYIDYPFDLSGALFIATANNTTNIATAVLDRLEVMQMPAYSDQEKIMIGRNFLLPKILRGSGVDPRLVQISDSVWPLIVRPLGYDAGMRTLERTIEGLVRKVARSVAEGKTTTFQFNETNIKEYLPQW